MRSFSSLILIAAICTSCVVAQQSLVPFQGQVIAFTPNPVDSAAALGDLAPGCGGDRFGSQPFPSAVIDGSGKALFRAKLVSNTGATLPVPSQFAYFYGNSRTDLVKVVRGGDPELSGTIAGAVVSTSTGNGLSTSPPRISDAGTMMFTASIWDAGVSITTANDTVLYYGTPGNFQIIAREGDAAPGMGGALWPNFGGLSTQQSGLNSAGYAIWQASFATNATTTPPVTSSNNVGWFRRDPSGAVSLIVREGDLAPGAGGEVLSGSYGFLFQMNSLGTVVADVGYLVGSGVSPVTTANDKAIWLIDAAGAASVLVREGDACAAIPGTNFATASSSWNYNTGSSTFNVSGQLLNWTVLTGAVTAGSDDGALMLLSAAGQTVVYRRGDLAPGVQTANPGAKLDNPNFSSLGLNDGGRVSFAAVLVGGGVTTTNDTGIWTGTAGNLALVAREGDPCPGVAGRFFGNTTGVGVHINALGQLVFSNSINDGPTPTVTESSVWAWDPVLGLQCLTRNGDSIEVQPAVFRTSVGQTGSIQFTNNDGRPLFFANDGTVAFPVTMTDAALLGGSSYASSAMVIVRIGSLTGVPGKISEAAGGTHNLYLNAGAANAGLTYVVAGTASGTMPGTQIGLINVPLNIDAYTMFTLQSANVLPFVNTFSLLNADGRGLAQIVIPAAIPGLAGSVVYHAYGVLDAFNNLVFASEPARLEITP